MRALPIVIAVFLATAPPAAADPKQDAAQLYKDGEKLYKASSFADAARKFERAYMTLPIAEIAFSAAQAYRLQFQLDQDPANARRAIELYEIYTKTVTSGKRAGDAAIHLDNLRAAYRDLVAQGKAKDDRIAVDRTQLTVWVPVEGAAITVDGKPAKPYDYIDVTPGEHVVEVKADGYQPYSQKTSVAKGAKVPVPVQLAALPATVKLAVERGARVAVDGRAVRQVDGVIEVPSGKRFLTISKRGRKPFSKELDLGPGASMELDARLETSGQRTAARWALLGSGVLLGLTAVTTTFTFYAQSKAEDQFGRPLEDGGAYTTWRDRRNTFRTTSIVLGTATVFTAGAALALYYFDNPSAEAAPPSLAPPTPDELRFRPMGLVDGAGLSLEGAW